MAVTSATCDECTSVIEGDDIHPDYDGRFLCVKCTLACEIYTLEDEISDKKKWLEETHLQELRKMGNSLKKLKAQLKEIEEAE